MNRTMTSLISLGAGALMYYMASQNDMMVFADLSGDKKQIHSSGEPLEVGRSTIVLNE
ncbi:DUF3918 domain-containing protein [Bacillus licheniformis]|nr:DUF3918 domain-containing protein [Bacillus licheniformis]